MATTQSQSDAISWLGGGRISWFLVVQEDFEFQQNRESSCSHSPFLRLTGHATRPSMEDPVGGCRNPCGKVAEYGFTNVPRVITAVFTCCI